jgi:UDP-N-acetyl-D-galactosamine dehydrogenase
MTMGQLRTYCTGKNPVLADLKALYNRDDAASAGFTVFRL